jgi:putative transposase
MSYAFIREHVADFPVEVMCEVLRVSRSGYYAWASRVESARGAALIGNDRRRAHGIVHVPLPSPRSRAAMICAET